MKDQIKDLLIRLVREAIDSQQQATQQQTPGNHPDQEQGDQNDQASDAEQMSDADQKKLADLTKKQAQFNDAVRKIDGEAQKLQEPVRRKMEDLQRKKAKAQQGLGSATDQISSIKKKYNIKEGKHSMKRSELKELIRTMIKECNNSSQKWDDAAGYDINDPKHPDFADKMADKADMDKEKSRELQEAKNKGLSGMKKAPEKKDNTQMKSGDKTITKTTTPKEKTETKKLPVVKKPAQPKGEKIKEEILKMVRDVIRENVTEMARTAVELGDDGIVHGSISTANRKQDPKSPTGWSIVGHKKFPDGTPCDAPKNTGANYVKKNPTAPSGSMGRPKKEVSSTITVNVNGKSIDQFSFKLPSGKDDTRPLKTMVDKFFYEKNPEMAAYGLDPSVYTKFEEMADLYIDDALPANALVDLTVKNVGGEQVLTAK